MSDHGVYRNEQGEYCGRDYEPIGTNRLGEPVYTTRFLKRRLSSLPLSTYEDCPWRENKLTFLFPWEFLE